MLMPRTLYPGHRHRRIDSNELHDDGDEQEEAIHLIHPNEIVNGPELCVRSSKNFFAIVAVTFLNNFLKQYAGDRALDHTALS